MVRTCLRDDEPGWVLVGVLGSPFKSKTNLKIHLKWYSPLYLIILNNNFLQSMTWCRIFSSG